LAPVSFEDGCGFIDLSGKLQFRLPYERCQPFQGDVAVAVHQRRWGLVNREGKTILEPQFNFQPNSSNGEFFDGMAIVQVEGAFGYISGQGAFVVAPIYRSAGDFSEGLAPVGDGRTFGYVAKTGEVAIPMAFQNAGVFSEGLAPVQQGKRWGFIDREGALRVTPAYDWALPFKNGLARVGTAKGWAYIDPEGRLVWQEK
jgi:hypothetical protein